MFGLRQSRRACVRAWHQAHSHAGEDVEGVPVLRAAEGVPVSFSLLEAEDVQAVEQHLGLVLGVEGHVGVIGPRVMDAEQLAGEDPAGGERPADPRPQGRELLRRTERRLYPAWIRCSARQVRSANDVHRTRIRPAAAGGMRPEQREPGWLGVDCHDQPAASQQLQRVGALTAAQVDRHAVPAGPELLAGGQQQRPRLTASRPRVVSSPARAAIIGHCAIMPVRAAQDSGFAVPDPAAAKPGRAASAPEHAWLSPPGQRRPALPRSGWVASGNRPALTWRRTGCHGMPARLAPDGENAPGCRGLISGSMLTEPVRRESMVFSYIPGVQQTKEPSLTETTAAPAVTGGLQRRAARPAAGP